MQARPSAPEPVMAIDFTDRLSVGRPEEHFHFVFDQISVEGSLAENIRASLQHREPKAILR